MSRAALGRLAAVVLQQRLALRRRQRAEVGAPAGRGGDVHARADVGAREDDGRARAHGVDHEDVQPVANAQVHARLRAVGQLGQVGPTQRTHVEVAQVGAAQVQQRRAELEALAVGVLLHKAAGHQGGREPRHGGLGDARRIGQGPIRQRPRRVGQRPQHSQSARQRRHLVARGWSRNLGIVGWGVGRGTAWHGGRDCGATLDRDRHR